MIYALMLGLFGFSGYCGVRSIQRAYGWLRLNQVLWAIQVPVLQSGLLSYSFASGGFITAWVQLYPPLRVGGNAWVGGAVTINLFAPNPIVLGVNVVALAICLYLARLASRGDA